MFFEGEGLAMKKLLSVAFAVLAAGVVSASPARVTAQSIIVNPVPSPQVGVRVWVDRDTGGYGNSTYRVGEQIRIGVNVTEDAYVYLFNVNANGEINLILPNAYQGGENFLYAGETRTFPAPGANFRFTIDGPAGIDKVLAVASTQPLDMGSLYDAASGGFYEVEVSGQANLARALSIIVEPIPAQSWVTDTVQYRVRY
jgi:uncharacterized protein with LGFP repeats